MRYTFLSGLAVALVSSTALAQKVSVFPVDHRDFEGTSRTSSNPLSGGVSRQLFLYDSSLLDMPNGVDIKRVGFRQDGGFALAANGAKVQLEVRMGASKLALDKANRTYDRNYDGNATVVFSKKIVDLPSFAKPTSAPSKNFVWITLDRPYRFDKGRNLVVEYLAFANNKQNRSFPYLLDFATFASRTEKFGTACKGSNDKAMRVTPRGARIGSSWTVSVQDAAGASVVAFLFATNKDKLGGVVPLPFSMTSLGAPGCFVNVDPLIAIPRPTSTSGSTSVTIPIPRVDELYQQTFYGQFLSVDPFANALGMTTSQGVGMTLGRLPKITRVWRSNNILATSGFVDSSTGGQVVTAFDHN